MDFRTASQTSRKDYSLFQPAEEGSRGARAVSASGLLDEADYFAAAHVGMMARTGEVVIDPYGFLCGTKFNVDFKGRAAHCASEPEAREKRPCSSLFGVHAPSGDFKKQ